MPVVPAADQTLIARAVGNAAREFLTKTELLSKRIDPIDVTAKVDKYTFKLGSALYEPVRIKDAWFLGAKLLNVSLNTLQNLYIDYKQYNETPRPTHFYQEDYKSITLFPPPSETITAAVTGDAVVTLVHNPAVLPDDLLPYREVITIGAIGKLLVGNNPAISNPQLGAVYLNDFVSRTAEVSQKALKSYSSELRVRPRRWL